MDLILFEIEVKETKENKETAGTEDLELELENLDINDETLDLDCGDEAEDLTKKLLDEQGKKDVEKFVILINW